MSSANQKNDTTKVVPSSLRYLMPQTGFEPVHGYPYNDLNVARLPIPPLGQRNIFIYNKCAPGESNPDLENRNLTCDPLH